MTGMSIVGLIGTDFRTMNGKLSSDRAHNRLTWASLRIAVGEYLASLAHKLSLALMAELITTSGNVEAHPSLRKPRILPTTVLTMQPVF